MTSNVVPRTSRGVEVRRPGRTPQVDAAAVEAAALELFAERGYRATTMADIGEALGIRGPSLYKHVQSKQSLLATIMMRTMTRLLDDQRAALEVGSDITAQLRRMVESHVRFHTSHRAEALVGNREINNLESPSRERVVEMRRSFDLRLQELIAHGVDAGVFRVDSPKLAAYAILGSATRVAVWYREGGPESADHVAYTFADLAVNMLTGPASSASRGGRRPR